jgi:Uma2 family endonuclease
MSGAVKILPHYTYEDYVQWEGRWELIDGIPYAMSPAPIPKHQIVAGNLLAEFRFALKGCKHCKVMQPVDYKISEDNVFQPDMLVVCKPIEKKYLDFPPSLVTEVVSPSSVLIDRHKKFYAYQEQGIPFYLIVSPDSEETEVYALEVGEYVMKQKGKGFSYHFPFEEDCAAAIDFAEIWK